MLKCFFKKLESINSLTWFVRNSSLIADGRPIIIEANKAIPTASRCGTVNESNIIKHEI